ncbi:MAG: hypothetical protein ABIH03_06850, partial [Pseudomonadota bacterium]
GPLPLSKLAAWAAEDYDRHVYDIQPAIGYLPFTDGDALEARRLLDWATTAVRYAPLQCLSNWFERRTGILIARHRQKDLAWTCSETCARIMPVRCADLYGWPDSRASEIVPSGDYLPSVWTGTDRLIRRDGVRAA